MKSKTKVISIVLFLSVLIIFVYCGRQKTEWKGTIEEVDGVTVVKNPKEPMYGEGVFSLEEELSIGETEGRKEYILKEELSISQFNNNYLINPGDIEVDKKGRIYVAERYVNKPGLLIFDKNGRLIYSILRKGGGPGDFRTPIDIEIDNDKELIHILDTLNRRISVYDFSGNYKSDIKISLGGECTKIFLSDNGYFLIVVIFDFKGNRYNFKIVEIDSSGEVVNSSEEFLANYIKPYRNRVGSLIPFPFSPQGMVSCNKETDSFYYGFSDEYKINVMDTAFKKIKVIRNSSPERLRVTKEDKEEYIKDYLKTGKEKNRLNFYKDRQKYIEFPKYHPHFTNMWIDDRGRLLVRIPSKDNKAHIDIFNKNGVYSEKIMVNGPADGTSLDYIFHDMPRFSSSVFRDSYIYTIVLDNKDEFCLKNYRLLEK